MNLSGVAANAETEPTAASPLRARLVHGAALLPKLGAAALAAFLVIGVGAPWLLFDAPPSPYEAFALKALCRDAVQHPQAACRPPVALSTRTIAAPGSLSDRLK
jgi:hypothetical protein